MRGNKKRLSKSKAAPKRAPAKKPAPVAKAAPTADCARCAPSVELISAEELCELTGFSDSYHRKIAAQGYFPPPIQSAYQKKAAIMGLFKHQREIGERSKESLAQKQEILLDKKIERADFDMAVSRQQFKPTDEVAQKLMAISEEQKSALTFYLLDQLPSINAGLGAVDQRKNNRTAMVAICKRFQDWAQNYTAPAKPAAQDKPS